DIRINKIWSERGAWPPPKKALLLERGSLGFLSTQLGRSLLVELPDGKQRELLVAGSTHDVSVPDAQLAPFAFGFITLDTLEWLGQPRSFSQLLITVAERSLDEEHIKQVTEQVRNKLEKGGRPIYGVQIPTPGKHWADDIIQALLLILGVLGVLSLLM